MGKGSKKGDGRVRWRFKVIVIGMEWRQHDFLSDLKAQGPVGPGGGARASFSVSISLPENKMALDLKQHVIQIHV